MSLTIHQPNIYDVIIVGGGAAGLFCSASFDQKINGLILEKTKHPGTKLLLSGGGQCNITHTGSIKDFPPRYGKNGGTIRGCLYKYNHLHLTDFLKENGIETVIREDGKIFPASLKASQVLEMLLKRTKHNGFDLQVQHPVTSIAKGDGFYELVSNGTKYKGRNIVLATGGCSYPTTGSDGTMFSLLKKDLSLDITPLRPSLSPVNVEHYPYGPIAGIAFPHIGFTLWRDDKKILDRTGPILFTHENFSGPLMLNVSKEIREKDKITLNYLYPWDKSTLLKKINGMMAQNKLSLANLLSKELNLPKSFLQILLADTGERLKSLTQRLTEDQFIVKNVAGFHKAMVTSGGVNLSQVDVKTMGLKDFSGIYVIGEALDIDGETGGYNLQFAYSSARAASNALQQRDD